LAQTEPVIVMRQGTPFFALIPLDEFDYETWTLSENPDFMALIERARERYRQEGGVPLTEVRRQLGLITDEP
jgi:PHD/YefM family antitoxin component YafN of YafNO toxin-antitoxin module